MMDAERPIGVWEVVRRWWNRAVAVDFPDEESRRRAWLFNTAMLISVGAAFLLSLSFVVAGRLGFLPSPMFRVALAFPVGAAFFAAFCFFLVKRGNFRLASYLYLGGHLLALSLAIFLFHGPLSSGWVLYLWSLAVAGFIFPPRYVLLITMGVLGYYGVLYAAMLSGFYEPVWQLSPPAFRFLSVTSTLITLAMVGGILNILGARNLREIRAGWQRTVQMLANARRELEEHVQERTAELERRAEQFQAIAEVSRTAAFVLDMGELMDTAVKLIAQRFGYDHVGIFLLDESGEWAVLRAASSEGGRRMLARGHRLRVGEQGLVGYVARTGVPRIALDVGEDAVWLNNPDLPETRSEMVLPLVARGRTVGVLDTQSNQPAAFSEEDIDVLRVLADGIAVALDNARLFAETQRMVERLGRLQEQDAVRAWRRALARRRMRVDMMYMAGDVSPASPDEVAPLVRERPSELRTWITEEGMHRLVAPVSVRGQRVGVLAFEKARPWQEEELRLTEFVVEQLSLALENARLLEETRLRAAQEAVRSDIVSRLRRLSTTDAILRNAARELGIALQVERSRIQLLPPSEREG